MLMLPDIVSRPERGEELPLVMLFMTLSSFTRGGEGDIVVS